MALSHYQSVFLVAAAAYVFLIGLVKWLDILDLYFTKLIYELCNVGWIYNLLEECLEPDCVLQQSFLQLFVLLSRGEINH